MLHREKYLEYRKRSVLALAQGCLTNSKHPKCFVDGVYPTTLVRSQGCYTWDVDGNRYIDFICSLGVNLIGAGNETIKKEIALQLDKGTVFSLGSKLELEFAEKIKEYFPYIEKVKVLKSGSEGCAAAVRIARAYTKKSVVVSEGYHGWHDEFTSLTPPANGVPKIFTEIRQLRDGRFPDAACIIVEPVITDISTLRIENLKRLRRFCDENGALLIFDETITALRFPGLSFSNWSGIRPDITVMGKSLGGGLPLTIVGGKAEVMDSDYFVSSTFAGDTTAMAASLALLNIVKGERRIDKMWDDGSRFLEQFNKLNPDLIQIVGYPAFGKFVAKDDLTKALFMQLCVRAGVLFHPVSWFWNWHHNDEARDVLEICKCALHLIAHGEAQLEGVLPVSPQSQRSRDDV